MSKPLELWLSIKLGRIVRLESTEMANLLFDGKIFSELVASYGILAGVDLKEAEQFSDALNNLKALNEALSLVGLEQNDETLMRIAQRDQSVAVRLLFEIYMHLEQYWPHSKCSVLGEPSYAKYKSSEDNFSRISSSDSSFQSEIRSPRAADDISSSASLSRILQVYKEDTIAACKQEMNTHRTSFGFSSSNKR